MGKNWKSYGTRYLPVPGISQIFGGIGTGIETLGTGKKSRHQYRKNLEKVSKLSNNQTSIAKVSEKFGTELKVPVSEILNKSICIGFVG